MRRLRDLVVTFCMAWERDRSHRAQTDGSAAVAPRRVRFRAKPREPESLDRIFGTRRHVAAGERAASAKSNACSPSASAPARPSWLSLSRPALTSPVLCYVFCRSRVRVPRGARSWLRELRVRLAECNLLRHHRQRFAHLFDHAGELRLQQRLLRIHHHVHGGGKSVPRLTGSFAQSPLHRLRSTAPPSARLTVNPIRGPVGVRMCQVKRSEIRRKVAASLLVHTAKIGMLQQPCCLVEISPESCRSQFHHGAVGRHALRPVFRRLLRKRVIAVPGLTVSW